MELEKGLEHRSGEEQLRELRVFILEKGGSGGTLVHCASEEAVARELVEVAANKFILKSWEQEVKKRKMYKSN
ncbi:hypothetical protein TURU_152534 [Turdus rufiventris]|nr:hypothetical protein TURU_152534 [Turdus rufiventris]